jgi:hypothetical protein
MTGDHRDIVGEVLRAKRGAVAETKRQKPELLTKKVAAGA